MPSSRKLTAAAIAAAATMGIFAAATSVPATAHDHAAKMAKQQLNIVETAQSTGVHNTLVAAVNAADLGDVLANEGPFTVFAPTDAGFAKLPAGTVETLIQPENKAMLTGILTYHVVSGNVTSSDLVDLIGKKGGNADVATLAGEMLNARLENGAVIITDAAGRNIQVVQADVKTANGIIHVTDGVFLPG